MLLHPFRGLAAACSGNADGSTLAKTPQQRGIGDTEKKNRRNTVRCQGLHHIGRAGEVVAVIADEKIVHRRYAPLPSLNFAIEAASSGWSLA